MSITNHAELRGYDAWQLHHSLVYADRPLLDGALLSATKLTPSGMTTLGFSSATDAAKYWQLAHSSIDRGESVYVSVGVLRPETSSGPGRGRKDDVVAIPALVADLDFRTGNHSAGDRLPTEDEVHAWIADLPLEPTLVTHTGGGAHIWLSLADTLDPTNLAHRSLLADWKDYWRRVSERDDRAIDLGVIGDIARILRPAGSVNSKYDTRVDIVQAREIRHSLRDLERVFATPETDSTDVSTVREVLVLPRATEAARVTPAPGPESAADDQRVGSRFARTVPVSTFIQEVWRARLDATSRVTFPDGERYDPEPNAQVYTDDGIETLTVFGARVQTELGLDSQNHRLNSWGVWSRILFRGDYRLAARVLAAFDNDRTFDEGALALARRIAQSEIDLEQVAEEYPGASDVTIREAIDGNGTTKVELGDGLFLKVGTGRGHGLFLRQPDDNGKAMPPRRIANWIGWHRKVTTIMSADANGIEFEVAPARYEVQLVDERGRRKSREDLSVEQATDPKQVLNKIDLGLALPEIPRDKARAETMLRTTGRIDATEYSQRYATVGWMRDPEVGRHVYLAPAGSVDAEGVTHRLTVGAPAGSDAGALNPAAEDLGFPSIAEGPEQVRQTAGSLSAFFRLTPRRPEVAYALLGLLFASVLGLSRRATIALIATPQAGKSLLMAAIQAFISGVVNGSEFTGGAVGKGTTPNAAMVKLSWLRHTLGCWDDFRAEANPIDNARVKSVVSLILQASYGSDGSQKGTREGGLRAQQLAQTTSIFTGEGTPSSEGLVSRLIHIALDEGDVAKSPRGQSPYDEFVRVWAPEARRLFGGYVSWLANKIDELGSLKAFTRMNDVHRTEWTAGGEGRASETVSMIALGWRRLREFAVEFGFDELLPSEAEVDSQLKKLVEANREQISDANPALVILGRIRDLIASGLGHIDGHDTKMPLDPHIHGWRRNSYGEWAPGGPKLGVRSADGEVVVVTSASILDAARSLDMKDIPKDQIERGALAFVVSGTKPGGRVPASILTDRIRGWAVPSGLLDLDKAVPGVESPAAVTSQVAGSSSDVHFAEEVLFD